jgi:hypothetical protein
MIKTFSKLSAVGAVVLLSTTLAARASMLNGSYTNLDMETYVSLWDVSGEYSGNLTDLGSGDFTLTLEPSGKYTGTGDLEVEGNDYPDSVTVKGAVNGSSKKPSMSMKLDFSATDTTIDTVFFKSITENLSGTFSFDFAESELIGKGDASAKAVYLNPKTGKYDTRSASEPFKDKELPMVSDMTGNWALVLNLVDESDTKYSDSSTASIVTSAGNSVDFTVTGTYSAEKDKSTLTLKGTKGSDCNLTLDISGDTLTIDSISGKAFGQTLSYKLSDND